MATAPNTANLQIPKGIVSFQLGSTGDFRDLGEVSNFTVANDITKKDKFSSRSGIRSKIKTVVTQLAATAKLTLDEINGPNCAMFALSTTSTDSDGNYVLTGLSKTQFEGVLKVVGTNDVGPQIDWIGTVSFTPSGDFKFVEEGDDWNSIELEADVLQENDGTFGTWTIRDQS